MRHFTAHRSGLLFLLTGSLLGFPPLLQAQEAVSNTSASFADTTATETKGSVPANDLGTGIFSTLPFKVSFNVRGGYDDNVTTSTAFKKGSPFTNAGVGLTYDFGDARTQLTLATGAGFTYFWDNVQVPGVNSNDYDINTYVRLAVTHKATPRLTLSMVDYLTYQTEPDFAISQGVNRRGGNYFFTQDKFTANYLWAPRFATATSYTLGAIRYDNSGIGFFSDRWENTLGNEFRFLISPTTTLVAEYRFEIISYDQIQRDSTTNFALAGFDHHFNTRFDVSLRGGAEFRSYDQQGGNRTSPYFEGTLNYAVGKQTTVTWTNRYAIEEPDVLLSPGRDTFRTGISARHEFTPKISASLAAYYEHDDYRSFNQPGVFSAAFTEEDVNLSFSLRYAITRYIAVEAGYDFTDVSSDVALREYTRNRYWGGVNVTF